VVTNGDPADFSVGAEGVGLAYQWRKDDAVLAEATNAVFAIAVAATNDTANYTVVVTNIAGAVTSSVASLTVLVPPSFALQPSNQTVVVGGEVTFVAAASGVPAPVLQWHFNTNLLVGEVSATLTITNAQPTNAGPYFALAMNSAGAATSAVARLAVTVLPLMTPMFTNVVLLEDGVLALSGVGAAGQNYSLLVSSNLLDPTAWVPVATNTADTNGAWGFSDPHATNQPQRFYRVRWP
jgi:hypothetical protein